MILVIMKIKNNSNYNFKISKAIIKILITLKVKIIIVQKII